MPGTFSWRAEAALRRGGGRMTRRRLALLELIESQPRPLGLLELGLLHRVLGSTAVRPCAGREPRCHHAVVCSGCGAAREFHSRPLERALAEVRRATGFSIQEHLLELRGLCGECRDRA